VNGGGVRCARGPFCKFAELVDGLLIGGLIRPGQAWDLGHRDGQSLGGPEHAVCNRQAGALKGTTKTRRSRVW
jgi:hypothetical protein